MSDMTFDAREIVAASVRYGAAKPIVEGEMLIAMERSTIAVERGAKEIVPVLKGHLRRSLTRMVTAFLGTVGTNLPYARPVHDGRREVRPVNARVLRWVAPGGGVVFSMRSRATKGVKFLTGPFQRLQPQIRREFAQVPKRIIAKMAKH